MDSQRSSYGKEYGSDDGKGGQSGTLQVSQQVGADTQKDDKHIHVWYEPDNDRSRHAGQPVVDSHYIEQGGNGKQGGYQSNQPAPGYHVLKVLHGKYSFKKHGAEGKGRNRVGLKSCIGSGNPEQDGDSEDAGRSLLITAHGL